MEKNQRETVTIALVQTSASEDAELNLRLAAERVREAARRGARIVCLPELFRTRYFPQQAGGDFRRLAERITGGTTETMSALAKEMEIVIVIPFYEDAGDGRYFNSAVVADADGRLLETYRKAHVPHDECFYEKDYFADGDSGFRVYRTRHGAFAVLICYDQWFPEAARAATLMGADIIFYPTAIGWVEGCEPAEGDWRAAWETVQRGHAIANGVHVAAVNRVGTEGRLRFWGGSFVCDAFGTVVARAGEDEETLVVPVNLRMNREVREEWGFLRNRRPKMYGILER